MSVLHWIGAHWWQIGLSWAGLLFLFVGILAAGRYWAELYPAPDFSLKGINLHWHRYNRVDIG